MSKAAACALIALCSATDSLSAADDSPRPSYTEAKRAACTAEGGILTFSGPSDNRRNTCCTDEYCETCTKGEDGKEHCWTSCNVDSCCLTFGDTGELYCDWYERRHWYLVVNDPADESGLPSFEELQADDSLVVVDEGGPSTLIDLLDLQVGVFELQTDDSVFVVDDSEQYTPIGISEEFVWESVWHYTPIGDSEDYIWAYTPIGYEMEEIPQSLLDTLRDQAGDLQLEDELQADEDQTVVETSDESPPEQDATNPGARRRDGRSRRRGSRN
jgi:hypothetical protein